MSFFTVGVSLVGEIGGSRHQMVGTVYLPPGGASQTLSTFRALLQSELPPELTKKAYRFVTPKGWKINENLEGSLLVGQVLDEEKVARIQLVYQTPKIGVVVQTDGGRNVPLGFVFCEHSATLENLAAKIAREKLLPPHLIKRFGFVDRNGWPVASSQEAHTTVIEVMGDDAVMIHLDYAISLAPAASSAVSSHNAAPLPPPPSTSIFDPSKAIENLPATQTTPQLPSFLHHTDGRVTPTATPAVYMSSDILISYVHNEAAAEAVMLKQALQKEGYTVFLDVDSIEGGVDWQDALNAAITRCSLFVPLVTARYGQTLWTNREVKLADVLRKLIVPISFLRKWPPHCLAIQFSTTQYIPWDRSTTDGNKTESDKKKEGGASEADAVAKAIAQRYQKDLFIEHGGQAAVEEVDGETRDSSSSPDSAVSHPPCKAPSIKSYATLLPSCVPIELQETVHKARDGRPLVVIICHAAQKDLVEKMVKLFEEDGSEVWCSCDSIVSDDLQGDAMVAALNQKMHSMIDEAGVVLVVLSQDFIRCFSCQAAIFYSEQRKRIVPVICGSIQLPDWASMLVGTNPFVDSRSSSFTTVVRDTVRTALNPKSLECELADATRQKEELATLSSSLLDQLPAGKLVYISGGTKFFSPLGEQICIELGTQLARKGDVVLVTGGFYGVGDTMAKSFHNERVKLGSPSEGLYHIVAERDNEDKSMQTRQRADGTFEPVPYGRTLFCCRSVRQREMLTPRLLDLCILIEGGPGAAFEVQQFVWNEKSVVPVKVTGGAASGLFGVPSSIFQKPSRVSDSDWSLLDDRRASPQDVASAAVRVVETLMDARTGKQAMLRRRDTVIIASEGSTSSRKRSYSDI